MPVAPPARGPSLSASTSARLSSRVGKARLALSSGTLVQSFGVNAVHGQGIGVAPATTSSRYPRYRSETHGSAAGRAAPYVRSRLLRPARAVMAAASAAGGFTRPRPLIA